MITYLLFDLDNTLYPESSPLGAELSHRINKYAADYLDVSEERALELRRTEMKPYGTTMRWLIENHGLDDLEAYMEAVHPQNVAAFLEKDDGLKDFLQSLDLPKSILTNSPADHAHRVLQYLGIEECFEHLFDLAFSSYRGKPHHSTYQLVLSQIGRKPEEVMLVDDVPGYLSGFSDLGGIAVLMDEKGTKKVDDRRIKVIRKLADIVALLERE